MADVDPAGPAPAPTPEPTASTTRLAQASGSVVLIAVSTLLLTTGPLYRVRTWWSYDDPLAADGVVIVAQLAVATVAIAALVRGGRWRVVTRPFALCATALAAWICLGALWSPDGATTLRHGLLIAAALIAGVAAATVASPLVFTSAAWCGLHVGLAWSALAIVTVQPGTQDHNGEWTGVYFNPNSLALVAVVGILAAVVAALLVDDRRSRVRLWPLFAVSVVADLWLIGGTGALTPLVALGAGAAIAAVAVAARPLVGPTDGRAHRQRVAAAVTGGVLVAAISVLWLTRESWAVTVGRRADFTGRTDMWGVAVDWFERRPVAGWGYLGAWADAAFAADMLEARGEVLGSVHNSFVEVLLGAGIVGLALVVGCVAIVWIDAGTAALASQRLVAAWPLAATAFWVIENLGETVLVGGHVTVALLGAVAVSASQELSNALAQRPG